MYLFGQSVRCANDKLSREKIDEQLRQSAMVSKRDLELVEVPHFQFLINEELHKLSHLFWFAEVGVFKVNLLWNET